MSRTLPTRQLPEHPNLDQLKRQAKELLQAFRANQSDATAETHAHFSGVDRANFALHDAQLVLARSYGFESWPKLKAFVDGVTVRRLVDTICAGDLVSAENMVRSRPELADMALSYFDERRPIHFTVMHRLPDIMRLLLRYGANARAGIHPHRDATSAFVMAKDRGYDELVALIESEERRATAPIGKAAEPTIIREEDGAGKAVAEGNIDWIRAHHAAGTLINAIDWRDGGLLTVAVRRDRPDILTLLLDFGLDPNERVAGGQGDWVAYSQGYPLWTAAALGKHKLAEILLAHGADPNVHVDSSGSSVYSAYSHQQWEMVDLLRRHGGEVTADIAAIYRQTDLIRELLAGNANPEEVLRHGASGGEPAIVAMALARIDWAKDDPRWFGMLTEPLYFWHHIPWLYAGNKAFDRRTYLDCFRLILDRCDANAVGPFGRTPLHEVAAMRDHITEEEAASFAEELFRAGARVGTRDELLESTALGWACRRGRASVADAMLEHGADPKERDAAPWATPRAWGEKYGHAEIVEILRKYGG